MAYRSLIKIPVHLLPGVSWYMFGCRAVISPAPIDVLLFYRIKTQNHTTKVLNMVNFTSCMGSEKESGSVSESVMSLVIVDDFMLNCFDTRARHHVSLPRRPVGPSPTLMYGPGRCIKDKHYRSAPVHSLYCLLVWLCR